MMRSFTLLRAFTTICCCTSTTTIPSHSYYTNPVIDVNSPDPGVLAIPNSIKFVAVTSTGFNIETNLFPIRTSQNLVDWNLVGYIFPNTSKPQWAAAPFYAPEIHTVSLLNQTMYWAVYDATDVETNLMAVGAAWSTHPNGPYTDLGSPLIRGIDWKSTNATAIDATLWQNKTDSKVYLLFKDKQNGTRCIMGQELVATAKPVPKLKVVGQPWVVLTSTEDWEGHDVEGPFLWEEPGSIFPNGIYLFYSGSSTWGTTYAVGVARSTTIKGSFEKMATPVAHSKQGNNTTNTTFVSPGHNSVVRFHESNQTYLVYHANKWEETGTNCIRYMMVDKLKWSPEGWPLLDTIENAPSNTPLLIPGKNQNI